AKAFPVSEDLEADFANVITWRHKVAAHTSWVWPKADNVATQDMSIVLFPEFNFQGDEHFEVGGVQSGKTTGQLIMPLTVDASLTEEVSFSPDWRWALVRTHEQLKELVRKYVPVMTS